MTTEERIEKAFNVGEHPRLSVSNIRGSIKVQTGSEDTIQITAAKHVDAGRDPAHTVVEIFQDEDQVVARTRHHKQDRGLKRLEGNKVCQVDYVVVVPTACDVDINQVSGAIHVNGISGQVAVNAVEGDVEVSNITGQANISAVSAAVEGSYWNGRATVNTVSGSVQIADAQLSRVKARTVSGDLSLDTTVDESGRYDFHSVSGDVTLYLPSERGVESRGTTISGRLVCQLPHELTQRVRGGWRATVNGGGPPVRFHSVSGDLVLESKVS
jgi:DUF4097 and DUF4098 domain-containing protein YvlB